MKRIKKGCPVYFSPIRNYYARPYVVKTDEGKHLFVVENYTGLEEVEISETFFHAFATEFPDTSVLSEAELDYPDDYWKDFIEDDEGTECQPDTAK